MWQLFVVVLMTGVYYVVQDWLGRARLPVLWTIFLLVPLALAPYWFHVNGLGVFAMVKTYSIMACICWAGWLRFTKMGDKAWALRSIPWLLAANILEALIVDLYTLEVTHILNAIAALLLIATVPFSVRHTSVDRVDRFQTMRFQAPLAWICGYTIWNWTFVYLNYPELTGHHTAILSAALIVAVMDPEKWLQARAATLGTNLILMATSYSGTLAVCDGTSWFDESFALVVAVMSFAWMAIHAMTNLNTRTVTVLKTVSQGDLLGRFRRLAGMERLATLGEG